MSMHIIVHNNCNTQYGSEEFQLSSLLSSRHISLPRCCQLQGRQSYHW